MTDYKDFLRAKHVRSARVGFDVSDGDILPALYPWQRSIVRWACRVGRAALLEDCGLGKTIQQLEWSRQVWRHTGGRVLLLCPLAVQWQTIREAERFGFDMPIRMAESQADVGDGVTVTNYEKLHHFDKDCWAGVVLDEASILKSYTGVTKRTLIASFRDVPYKLACTATPAPNDRMELGNQSEFLGVMPSNEMLSRWFINDGSRVGLYRLRNHGIRDFWRWVASWAVCITRPSDIGGDDAGFILPPLNVTEHIVESKPQDGYLFATGSSVSATAVHRVKRASLAERAEVVAKLVNNTSDAWCIWCDTDYEADALTDMIPDACEVRGSHPERVKEKRLCDFSEGRERIMVTKAEVAGFGLNWQHCHRTTWFAGYSYERWYQAIRRLWRFGQLEPVDVHVIRSDMEDSIVESVRRKEAEHVEMQGEMAALMREGMMEELGGVSGCLDSYAAGQRVRTPVWLTSRSA